MIYLYMKYVSSISRAVNQSLNHSERVAKVKS